MLHACEMIMITNARQLGGRTVGTKQEQTDYGSYRLVAQWQESDIVAAMAPAEQRYASQDPMLVN